MRTTARRRPVDSVRNRVLGRYARSLIRLESIGFGFSAFIRQHRPIDIRFQENA